MKNGKVVCARARYRESEPDVTSTGIGKCYNRYRMFFSRRNGMLELIENDYSIRAPTPQETERFKRDLAAAAGKDRKVAEFLEKFPALVFREAEPEAEGPAGG